jgi:hypothetical protein
MRLPAALRPDAPGKPLAAPVFPRPQPARSYPVNHQAFRVPRCLPVAESRHHQLRAAEVRGHREPSRPSPTPRPPRPAPARTPPASPVRRPNTAELPVTVAQTPNATAATKRTIAKTATATWASRHRPGNPDKPTTAHREHAEQIPREPTTHHGVTAPSLARHGTHRMSVQIRGATGSLLLRMAVLRDSDGAAHRDPALRRPLRISAPIRLH